MRSLGVGIIVIGVLIAFVMTVAAIFGGSDIPGFDVFRWPIFICAVIEFFYSVGFGNILIALADSKDRYKKLSQRVKLIQKAVGETQHIQRHEEEYEENEDDDEDEDEE